MQSVVGALEPADDAKCVFEQVDVHKDLGAGKMEGGFPYFTQTTNIVMIQSWLKTVKVSLEV